MEGGGDIFLRMQVKQMNGHFTIRYPALRKFVEERHGKSFEKFMSTRVGKCSNPDGLAKWSTDMRERLLSDFNLMGAFLW